MIKKYISALRSTKDSFKGKEKQLLFWIIVRGLSLTFTPIIFPLTIKIMFDAVQTSNNERTLTTCLLVVLYIIPVYLINYYICYYSDTWVIKQVYLWMKTNIEKVSLLPYEIVSRRYDTGELQNCVISGSWAGIQAWVHLFRLISPTISVVVLAGFFVSYSYFFLFLVIVVSVIDIIINELEARGRYKISKKINENGIEREQKIGEIVNKIEYICMNGFYDIVIKDYKDTQNRIWEQEKKNTILSVLFETLNEVLERTVTCMLAFSLFRFNLTGQLSSGAIGSAQTIFDNLRERIKYVKSQTEVTVGKVNPIDRLNALIRIDNERQEEGRIVNEDTKVAISIKDVTFSVAGVKILDGLNLTVNKKEKVAIIGNNGSGKTSFMRIIAGLYTPDIGRVHIYEEKEKPSISYAPSSSLLFDEVSAMENIEMANNANSVTGKELIDAFELRDVLNNKARQLSGGQAQKVNIARSLVKSSKIVLMDEPTASLDEKNASKVGEMMRSVNETLVYITHDPKMLKYADRVVVFDKGKIVFVGKYNELIKSDCYIQWYKGREKSELA